MTEAHWSESAGANGEDLEIQSEELRFKRRRNRGSVVRMVLKKPSQILVEGCHGLGGRGYGKLMLMVMEFLFGKKRKLWRRMVLMVA